MNYLLTKISNFFISLKELLYNSLTLDYFIFLFCKFMLHLFQHKVYKGKFSFLAYITKLLDNFPGKLANKNISTKII